MNPLFLLKPSIFKLLLAISAVALAAMFACTSDPSEEAATPDSEVAVNTQDLECPDLVEQPDAGQAPLGPPPALPNLFSGTALVNGEPVPQGELVYVKLTTSRSYPAKVLENGKFINIIHGPVSELDKEVPFVFCLGDPEGRAVKAAETIEFKNEPFLERDVELNFPMLPSELSTQ